MKGKGNPEASYTHEVVESSRHFDPRSFRIKKVGSKGHRLVFGCPRGQWQPREQRCKVGVGLQKIMRPNSWPDDRSGHARAAGLGWARRKQKLSALPASLTSTPLLSHFETISLTPAQKLWLPYLRTQVEEGEPGSRIITESGEWLGYSSTYPEWMRGQGWTKEEVLKVFNKLEGKVPFCKRHVRQLDIADVVKGKLARMVRWTTHETRRSKGIGRESSNGSSSGSSRKATQGFGMVARAKSEDLPEWVLSNSEVPKFKTREEYDSWMEAKIKKYGGRNKWLASQEYRDAYPELEKIVPKLSKRQRKVAVERIAGDKWDRSNIGKYQILRGTWYGQPVYLPTNIGLAGLFVSHERAIFDTKAEAERYAKKYGYTVVSKDTLQKDPGYVIRGGPT